MKNSNNNNRTTTTDLLGLGVVFNDYVQLRVEHATALQALSKVHKDQFNYERAIENLRAENENLTARIKMLDKINEIIEDNSLTDEGKVIHIKEIILPF